MKKNLLLNVLLILGLAAPVWADSRSTTVNVSCTIPPMLELSSRAGLVETRTTLEKQFQRTENVCVRNGQKVLLHTISAF